MQRETSNDTFLDYGSVYHQPIDREHPELIHQTMVAITRRYVSQFYCFNCDTYLQVKSGIGVLLVSHTAEAADVQEFAMNRLIHIKPNIYFAVVSTTQKLEYDLYAESSYLLHITDFPSQYEFLAVLPRIEIQKILGYYYRIRTENYCFHGERHDFFELTYVDTGELETEVDGTLYHLKEKDLMIYGPGQFHTQYTDEEHRASYMTILFDMRNLTPVEREVWYDALINRVFHYDQKINTLLKTFVRESTTGIPYMNSLMLCLLTETIIRLLQGTYALPHRPPPAARPTRAPWTNCSTASSPISTTTSTTPSPSRRSASTSRCPGPLCSCCSRTRWTSRPKSISTTRSWSAAVRCSSRTAIPSAKFRCVWATAPSIISPSPST